MRLETAPVEEVLLLHSSYQRTKRILDVIVTLLLLPLLCPVMAIIALLIRIDSEGPILFRQKRVGQHGQEFEFLKFRSMFVNNDNTSHRTAIEQFINGEKINSDPQAANQYKISMDQRVTRVGRFLRKTSLDELPQFFNILHGEMSLVGPRPALPYEVALYSFHDQLRLAGKPGLTGIWQVHGRSRVPFKEMVTMDVTYLQQQSLLLDLKLILLTVPVILFARGGE